MSHARERQECTNRSPVVPLISALLLVVVLTAGSASSAAAYSGSGAASFANQWATPTATTWSDWCYLYGCFGSRTGSDSADCTNFVSNAVRHGGGYPFRAPSGSLTDDHNWFQYGSQGNFTNTHSWSVANDYYTFLLWDYPGGYPQTPLSGTSTASYDGLSTGDVLFYDFVSDGTSNGVKNHAAIQVGHGLSTTYGYFGDLVDAHSHNRYREFWTLAPFNPYRSTTTITPVHISASN